jgi:hypothetical protein
LATAPVAVVRLPGLVRVVAKGPRSMTVTDSGMTALTEVM